MVQINSKGHASPAFSRNIRSGAKCWWKAILVGIIGILFLSTFLVGVVVTAGSSSSNSTSTPTTTTTTTAITTTDAPDKGTAFPVKQKASNEAAIPDYSLAYKQSYGFFDDITNENWKLLQSMAVDHENHKYPEAPLTHNPAFDKRKEPWNNSGPAWYQNNYEPNFSCQFEKRVGQIPNGDGPKWICDPHRIKKMAARRKAIDPNHPGCVIYSIGSNGDFNFELGMQKEVGEGVCEFHIFDMGDWEGKVPKELKRTYYHRWGLKKQEHDDDPKNAYKNIVGDKNRLRVPAVRGEIYYGLQDIVKLLGHENLDVIDIFKIDCERCEWDTYQDWLGKGIPLLHQIQVEVHDAPGQTAIDFFDSFERAGYLRFHKEPNIQYSDGGCLEYSFVKVEEEFLEGKHFSSLIHRQIK